jgi:nucleoside-diphosphate-sugar epimerase
MSNVLVVGGAGYVGGHLSSTLVIENHNVRVIDNLTYEESYLKDIDFIFGDVCAIDTFEKHLKWADCIIWLAAIVGDSACALNPELTQKTNVSSVQELVKRTDARIIFPSTCSIYGAQTGILTENSATNPLSLYAESKLQAEEILQSARSQVLIFRLGTLFGISDEFSRLRTDLVLNHLTIKAFMEKRLVVFGGAQYRPLLHVKDFATAALPNIRSNRTGIYNLHCENISISALAKRIQEFVPDTKIITTEMSFQDSRNYRVSSDKAREKLFFEPKYSIDYGISEILKVAKEKRIRNFDNPRFTNSNYLKVRLNLDG